MVDRIKKLIYMAWHHKGLRHYGANTVWLFAEKAVRMAIGFIVGIYVARQLGPAKYGLLNYAISLVGIFAVISSLGLDSIVVRELVKMPEKRDDLLGTTFALKSVGVFLMLTILGCTLFFSGGDNSTKLIIIIIAAGYLFQVFQTIDFYFQAKVLSKYVAISQMTSWMLVSCGRAWGAWQGYPVVYFAWLEAVNMTITSLGYLLFYVLKVDNPFRWRFNSAIVRYLLKESWPLLLSGAAGMIYMRIDQVMIKSMLGDEANGYYAVAVRLVEVWYFIPMIICSSLFPSIVRAKKVSKEHYEHRLQMLFALMTWLAIAISVVMTLLGKYILGWLYGSEYINSIPILYIYVWATVFIFYGVARGKWLVNENLQKYSSIYMGGGLITNIVLNYILINKIGAHGAAIATVVSQFFSVILIPFFMKKVRISCYMFMKCFNLFSILRESNK